MDARTGEVRAMASWPPFDPNRASETPKDDPGRLNRATGAVYELGSIFKPLTVAAAIDSGAVRPGALFDTSKPIEISGFKITDDHPIDGQASLARILADSSNIGTVKVNEALGPRRQVDYFNRAGLMARAPVELPGSATPLVPKAFNPLSAATASYGHGFAVSPMAFLSAFSAFANEGERLMPSLVEKPGAKPEATRVMSAVTADLVVTMMREAVTDGTGAPADVAGYRVAGKTGTAEKPIKGGYDASRNVNSFAAVFPSDSPHYALIVTLDEPKTRPGESTAAYTAAPVAGRIIERVAPLLGVAPRFEDVRPEQNVMTVSAPRNDL
jgi:cell division protein FtsI (penicillin-binding protein 3)